MAYNRGKLKREIQKNEWLVKCDGVYTDDYAFDAAYNFQKTDYANPYVINDFWTWLKESQLEEEYKKTSQQSNFITDNLHREFNRKYEEYERSEKAKTGGQIKFYDDDFRGFGHAWENQDGTVVLSFGYKSYTFKRKGIK